MSREDEFGLEDILNEIGAPDVDLGEVKTEPPAFVEKPGLVEAVKKGGKTVPEKEKQAKLKSEKRKDNTYLKERDDKYYSTTVVNKKLIKLIMLIYPEMYIRDAVEKVLKEWVRRNKSEIQKGIEESLKI